jgi:lipopolysaccharide export system permease protein
MRLLDRYLLRELLVPLGYCLGGFLIFWMAFDLFRMLNDFQTAGLSLLGVAQYYLVETPEILIVILPLALLLALLYALTNHARHHELTAIRSAGVSLWRLSLPYFGVGLALSLISFLINELWVPGSAEAAKLLIEGRQGGSGGFRRGEVRPLDFRNEVTGRLWHIGIYNALSGEMLNPKVVWPEGGSVFTIYANRAVRTNGVWTFYGVLEFKDSEDTGMPAPFLQTNVLACPKFAETPEQIKSEIKISGILSLPGARRTKTSDMSILEIVNYLRLHPHPSREVGNWLHTKLQGRLATPWTCLVVVVIAIPFGVPTGRRNVFVGVASSLFIGFTYFVLQQVCLALGSGGYMPPWLAAWSPNLSFGLAGLWMTARVR